MCKKETVSDFPICCSRKNLSINTERYSPPDVLKQFAYVLNMQATVLVFEMGAKTTSDCF